MSTQHLSEFFSIINKDTGTKPTSSTDSIPTPHSRYESYASHSLTSPIQSSDSTFATPHSTIPRKASLTSLATMTSTIASGQYAAGVSANHPDLPALITSREVAETLTAYNGLLDAAQKYRESLQLVSIAAASFGKALEECARCKGAGTSAESLLAAGGLHYLVSNHQQILSKSITRGFETPVRKEVEMFKATMAENEDVFKQEMRVQTRQLRIQERENTRLARMRVRNLAAYRSSLLELTGQIDDIDRLKYAHFCKAYEAAQGTSTRILGYAATVVRAEVEIYEGIARKGWSGGGLDDLIAACPDPFAEIGEEDEEEEVAVPTLKGNRLVKTIQGFLNINTAATTATNETTIKSLKPKPSLNLARATLAEAQPKEVSKSKSLFSILPSKSILPHFESKPANDTVSYESEDERETVSKVNILGGNTENAEEPSSRTTATEVFVQNVSTPQFNSLSSSFSSGFANQVSASTPLNHTSYDPDSPTSLESHNLGTSLPSSPKSKGKHAHNVSVSRLSPHHLMSAHTTATGTATVLSSSSDNEPVSNKEHIAGIHSDTDELLGYSAWGK